MRSDIRNYLIGLTVSTIGDNALSLVAGIWVDALTGSARDAGLVSVGVYAPSLLAPIAGALADRVRRRRMLVTVNLIAAALVLSLLAVRGVHQVWLIYAVMVVYGAVLTLSDPAESALFVDLVPSDDERASLNGLRLSIQEAGRLISPLAGAGLYVLLGGGTVAALDAVTFLAAAAVTSRLRTPDARPEPQPVDLLGGLRHIWHTHALRGIVFVAGLAILFSGVGTSAQYALVAHLHEPPAFNGLLAALLGAGSVVGGLSAGPMMRRLGEARLAQLSLLNGIVGYLLLAAGDLPAALLGSAARGLALPWTLVAAVSATQRLTPANYQGRVSSAVSLLLFGPIPLSLAAGALLVSPLGYRGLFAGAAAATLLLLLMPLRP